MDKSQFAFTRKNFIFLIIGMVIVLLGFLLMSGSGSTETLFNENIFSVQRIKVAPVICLLGFLFIIVAIVYSPKNKTEIEKKPNQNG